MNHGSGTSDIVGLYGDMTLFLALEKMLCRCEALCECGWYEDE